MTATPQRPGSDRPAFSVGYSGRMDDLVRLIDTSWRVTSVYTGGPAGIVGGGRPQYADSVSQLAPQAAYAREHGVSFEVALNAPCGIADRSDGAWWKRLDGLLHDLQGAGVSAIIASHPFVIEEVRSRTDLGVTVSTICEIATARAARYYEELGGTTITASMHVNHDLVALRRMRSALRSASLRVMVNEHCLGDCPWRRFHHSHYSHRCTEFDYHVRCKTMFLRRPYLVLTNNVIRPEDLSRYRGVVDTFKIVGRLVPVADLVERVRAYVAGTFDGNHVALSDAGLARSIHIPNAALDGLADRKGACTRLCLECGHCPELFRRHGACRVPPPPATAENAAEGSDG